MPPKLKKRVVPKTLKNKIWEKFYDKLAEGNCYCCGISLHITSFHAGHIIAEIKGGEMHIDNLRPICKQCNSSMGTNNMDDFIKTFKSVHFNRTDNNEKLNEIEKEEIEDEKTKTRNDDIKFIMDNCTNVPREIAEDIVDNYLDEFIKSYKEIIKASMKQYNKKFNLFIKKEKNSKLFSDTTKYVLYDDSNIIIPQCSKFGIIEKYKHRNFSLNLFN